MPRFVYTINLDDEGANYTIGQMLTHLQLSIDKTDFDKVEKLLKRREERIRGELLAEVEKVKSDVEVRGFLAEMEKMTKDLKDVESMYEELVKWKVMVEERFERVEKEKGYLVEENLRLRETIEELKKMEEAGKVRFLELEKSKITMKESIVKLTNKNINLVAENLKLVSEARVLREMNKEFKERVDAQKVRVSELEMFKVTLEESFEKVEKERGDLVEENLNLKREAKVFKVADVDLKKRLQVEKVRVSELEKLKVTLDERVDKLKKENGALEEDNQRLKKEARVWRATNEELKMREEAEKVRVLELRTTVEVEEGLRVRAEDDLKALEKSVKELELRISVLEKGSSMLMNCAGLDSPGMRRMVETTSLMDAKGFSTRSHVGIPNGYVVDLTVEFDGAHPKNNKQNRNFMEDSSSLYTIANPNESSPHTPHTKDNTKSSQPIPKPAAPISTTGANVARHGSGNLIHIPSDSDDETSDSPLRLKRKRVRSDKENPLKSDLSIDKFTSQYSLVHESKRTPGTENSIFCTRPGPSGKGERNIFHSSDAEWRKSVLNKLKVTDIRLFSSSSSDE